MTLELACADCGQPPSAQVHRIQEPSHAFRPSLAPVRLRRQFFDYDVITLSKSGDRCPRCGGMLFEDPPFGPCCLSQKECGWQERYAHGTVNRADGTLISNHATKDAG